MIFFCRILAWSLQTLKLLRKVVRDVRDSCPERPGRPGGPGRPAFRDVPTMPGPIDRKQWISFEMNARRAGAPAGILVRDMSRTRKSCPGQESGTTPPRFVRDVPDVRDGDVVPGQVCAKVVRIQPTVLAVCGVHFVDLAMRQYSTARRIRDGEPVGLRGLPI